MTAALDQAEDSSLLEAADDGEVLGLLPPSLAEHTWFGEAQPYHGKSSALSTAITSAERLLAALPALRAADAKQTRARLARLAYQIAFALKLGASADQITPGSRWRSLLRPLKRGYRRLTRPASSLCLNRRRSAQNRRHGADPHARFALIRSPCGTPSACRGASARPPVPTIPAKPPP